MAEANLRAKLTLDDNQFQQVLRTAQASSERAAKAVGGSWGKIMEYASGGAIANLVAKVGTGLADLATSGVKASASMEQTGVAFVTLLGSADRARQVLAVRVLHHLGAGLLPAVQPRAFVSLWHGKQYSTGETLQDAGDQGKCLHQFVPLVEVRLRRTAGSTSRTWTGQHVADVDRAARAGFR